MKSLQLTFNCFQFTESFTRKGRKSIALKSKSNSPSISMCHIVMVCQCEQLPRASRRWQGRAVPLPALLLHHNLAHTESCNREDEGWFHHQAIIRGTWGTWCLSAQESLNPLIFESSLVSVWQVRFWPAFGVVLVLEFVVTFVTLLRVL